jgi:hypothetical protein
MASHLLTATSVKSLKSLLLLGAIIGFLTGIALGLLNQSGWPSILWRSAAAALVVGILFRWWGRCWTQCLRSAQQERFAALMAQRKEKQSKAATKTS